MSAGPRRHHHLAQAVQRNFVEKGSTKLWWYSRLENKYEERTPRAIAHARNTYTFPSIDGKQRYLLEEALSKVENNAAPALKKLEAGEKLTQDEHDAVCELVGFQFIRTPSKIALVDRILNVGGAQTVAALADDIEKMTPEEFARYLEKSRRRKGEAWMFDQAELVDSLRNRPPRVTSTRELTLDSMVKLGTNITLEYSKRSWVVIHAPRDGSFITSDEGVFLAPDASVDLRGFGPLTKNVSVVFPFSKKAALLISGGGRPTLEHVGTDRKSVRDINDGLAQVSGEIYSHSRPLLESIVKRNNLAKTSFEVQVNETAVRKAISKSFNHRSKNT